MVESQSQDGQSRGGEGFQKFDGRPGQGRARQEEGRGQGRADKDLKDREEAWKSFGTGNSGRHVRLNVTRSGLFSCR